MWIDDDFYYSRNTLERIADNYTTLYRDGLPLRDELVTNLWWLAEYKADFDRALDNIGKGKWNGNLNGHTLRSYRHYGKLQKIIIATIIGVRDNELATSGFYDISRLRGYAYYLMKCFLNGGPNQGR